MPFATSPLGSGPIGGSSFSSAGVLPKEILANEGTPVFLLETTAARTVKFWELQPVTSGLWFTAETHFIQALFHNGVELGQVNTPEQVLPGMWCQVDGVVYLLLEDDASPVEDSNTVVLLLGFWFATTLKVFNGKVYEPLLANVPDLSLRVEMDFTGASQIGGGNSVFRNNEKFFDGLNDLDWDAGTTTIRLGFDRPQENYFMPYSNYKVIGTWTNVESDMTDTSFNLKLAEQKRRLDRTMPFRFYTLEEFPGLSHGDVGRAIQVAYGKIYGATPVSLTVELGTRAMIYKSVFGSLGPGSGKLNSPMGMAVHPDTDLLYVVDQTNNRVNIYEKDGTYKDKIGSKGSGEGEFDSPTGIAIGEDGLIYVVDTGNNRVQIFNANGNFKSKFGSGGSGDGDLSHPTWIALSANSIYIVDSGHDRVQRFTTFGTYDNFKFGETGTANGQFDNPQGIALTEEGSFLIVDQGNNRVQKFNSTGVYDSKFGSAGIATSEFDSPTGIFIDATGNIYVVDTGNDRVQIFYSTYVYRSLFGSSGTGEGEFTGPEGIFIDEDSNIFISDTQNSRVETFVQPYKNKFKLADHRITSIEAVRVARNNGWESLSVASVDLANGEFTVNGWDGESNLSVDFTGKALEVSGDIVPLTNPADIVEDILNSLGQVNIDTESFSVSRLKMFLGIRDGKEIHLNTPSLYLTGGEQVLDVMERINMVVGSYLFCGVDGNWRYVVFEPQPGEDLAFFDQTVLIAPTFKEDNEDKQEITELVVEYSSRTAESWSEFVSKSKISTQYSKLEPVAVPLSIAVPISTTDHARYWTERNLIIKGRTFKIYSIQLNWRGFLIQPSSQIRIGYDRYGLNKVLVVMETKLNVNTCIMELTAIDLHGFKDQVGFWRDDEDVLPARFSSLPGYGSRTDGKPDGSLFWYKGWDPIIKTWARQNAGFWTDDNGFADPLDEASFIPSCWF